MIDFLKLEELLVANWTKFLDSKKIMAFVLQTVRDRSDSFVEIKNSGQKIPNIQVMLSRFQIVADGFIVWVEFKVPLDKKFASGTTEFHLTNTGNITHLQTLGNTYID